MTKPDALALADQLETATANVDLAGLVRIEISSYVLDQAAAELRRLHNALRVAEETAERCKAVCDATAEQWRADVARLQAEAEALRKDAERYRWLKQEHERFDPVCHLSWKKGHDRDGSEWVNTHSLNVAIDAAMKEQP